MTGSRGQAKKENTKRLRWEEEERTIAVINYMKGGEIEDPKGDDGGGQKDGSEERE